MSDRIIVYSVDLKEKTVKRFAEHTCNNDNCSGYADVLAMGKALTELEPSIVLRVEYYDSMYEGEGNMRADMHMIAGGHAHIYRASQVHTAGPLEGLFLPAYPDYSLLMGRPCICSDTFSIARRHQMHTVWCPAYLLFNKTTD